MHNGRVSTDMKLEILYNNNNQIGKSSTCKIFRDLILQGSAKANSNLFKQVRLQSEYDSLRENLRSIEGVLTSRIDIN